MYKYWIAEILILSIIILAKYIFWFYYIPSSDLTNTEDSLFSWIGIS